MIRVQRNRVLRSSPTLVARSVHPISYSGTI